MLGSVRLFGAFAACFAVCFGATAQAAFPDKTVHLVVGYGAGGGTDILARQLAQKLSEKWHQPVLVENKPGADGSIAADQVARSVPDGYTIILITTNHTVPPQGYKLNYDPLKSFTPISELAYLPDILAVVPSLGVNSVKELITYAKAHPGQLNFASGGTGTAQYMDMKHFMTLAGIDMVNVPYKSGSTPVVALLSGEVQLMFIVLAKSIDQVRSGKIKALAVGGPYRSQLLPEVPTFPEAVPDMKDFQGSANWYGIIGPAGMPADVVNKLHDDFVEAAKTPEVSKALADQSFVTVLGTPQQFTHLISDELDNWATLQKSLDKK